MQLTTDQQHALDIAAKLCQSNSEVKVMVLRGSAGTGKTTLVRKLLSDLKGNFDHLILCAPTNKAADVLRRKTDEPAGTLHGMLYKPIKDEDTGTIYWDRAKPNKEERKLIIVDESSMISDRAEANADLFAGMAPLSDLLLYFSLCHPDSRLILVGDPCQLPPVGYGAHEESPALSIRYLEERKSTQVCTAELKEVVRQSEGSYVLDGAISLRNHLLYGEQYFRVAPRYLPNITAGIRHYVSRYDQYDESRVAMIAWTNSNVNWWNKVIRERLKLDAKTLMPDTRVIIDRRCLLEKTVLQKGQFAYVGTVNGDARTFANLYFLPITLQTFDSDGVVTEHECLALMDHLFSERGQLTPEQETFLQHEAMRNNATYRRTKQPSDDPYINAIRLRYGYAFTCHKAQGSEFDEVIVHPYLPKDEPRWLYTAVTRAKQELFTF